MKIRRALLALTLCLSLSACAAEPVPMQTMEEFLAETNQKHAAVVREEVDPTPYLRKPIEKEDPEPASVPRQTTIDHSVEPVSRQQALEDVEYLFQAFRSTYALYDYFGGDEVFNNAKQASIAAVNQYPSEQITPHELSTLLCDNLGFIKDGHFSLNGFSPWEKTFPFIYQETAFLKTEKGYCTTDGKYVKSVDGHDDLDELFKPSVSPEGELIYYPVLLQKYRNYEERRNKWQIPCQESLTVHYRDGSQQTLTAEPYIPYTEKYLEESELYPKKLSVHEVDGIPVIKLRHFSEYFRKRTWEKTFETYQDAPAIILDLRDNPGGDGIVPFLLFQAYLGEEVSYHYNCIDV